MFKTKKSKFGTKIPIICVQLTFRPKETIAIFDISFLTFSNLKFLAKVKICVFWVEFLKNYYYI